MSSYEKLMGTRVLLAGLVAFSLPLSHLWWGEDPGQAGVEGPTSMAFLVVFGGIGVMVALGYLVVGSILHFLMRRRPKTVVLCDLSLALLLVVVLAIGGVTATYSSAP